MQEFKNFFNDPNAIRNFALTQNYKECDFPNSTITYSGLRSKIVKSDIIEEISTKIENITSNKIETLSVEFHINPDVSMLGYPHYDIEDYHNLKSFACIIYLNDNVDYRNKSVFGTSLYKNISLRELRSKYEDYIGEMQMVYDINIPTNNPIKRKLADHCVNVKWWLKELKNFDYEYNKFIFYNAAQLHSPNHYFGETIEDSRLTIAIHLTFKNNLDENLYRAI